MKPQRGALLGAVTSCLLLVAACGNNSGSGSGGSSAKLVYFMAPNTTPTRYIQQDGPAFEKAMKASSFSDAMALPHDSTIRIFQPQLEAICRSVFSMSVRPLQIVTAIGEVEGLIDERKIRHDVADDRVFQHGPVLPGGVVRMTTTNDAAGIDLERHEYGSTPALDQSDAEGVGCGDSNFDTVSVARQPLEHEPYELARLL